MAVSANRLELLQIADAVAREKVIDREIVLAAMADAIQKAARSRYGTEPTSAPTSTRRPAKSDCSAFSRSSRRSRTTTRPRSLWNSPATAMSTPSSATTSPTRCRRWTFGISLPVGQAGHRAEGARSERDRQFDEFKDRVGEIVNGTVKRVEYGNVIVDLGRGEGIIRRDEMIPREAFRYGDARARYVYDVRREQRGPQIFLSRTHPQFMVKLFTMEVPEIYDGIIQIKSVARDPGSRAKIAVISNDSSIDPSAPASVCAVRAFRPSSANCRVRRSTSSRGARIRPPSSSTPCSRLKSPRSFSTKMQSASKSWFRTSSCRSPSAVAVRTCVWPRSSPAGTSTS